MDQRENKFTRFDPTPRDPVTEEFRREWLGLLHRIDLLHKLFFYAPRGMTFAHLTNEEIIEAIIEGETYEGKIEQ